MEVNDLDRMIDKPWGCFVKLTDNEKTTVKIISINAGNRTSLQFHEHRSEKWYVLSGEGYAMNPDEIKIRPGDKLFISKTTIHRLKAITDMKILEISFGNFDELDIKRLEDDYNR
jgi:mannose-6-phosphate isomerase-like protein (cupin superfamily)